MEAAEEEDEDEEYESEGGGGGEEELFPSHHSTYMRLKNCSIRPSVLIGPTLIWKIWI